jgi:small-conductance mechanosensitive channel
LTFEDEVLLGLRWGTLGAALGMLAAAALAHALLRGLVRLRVRRDEARAAQAAEDERERIRWFDRGLEAAVPPVVMLIWVYALSLALTLILGDLRYRGPAQTALSGLRILREIVWLAGLTWLLYRVAAVLELRFTTLSRRSDSMGDRILLPLAGKTVRLTLPLVVLILGVPVLPAPPEVLGALRNAVSLILIGTVAVLLYQLVQAVEDFMLARYRIDVADNLQARKMYTQVTVLRKVAIVVIGIFTLASMLMVFESVRQFGTSILASAGIAGVIIGFAAQRSIATLVAGFQIAVTQPIRIDDVVIVENEWGRIEDITLTYVVVQIWDLRRLVLPITYFIEKPFQNWTRVSAELLGSVFFHVDYTMPLAPLRAELDRILAQSSLWDGKVKVLQVTEAREHTLELRVLASARDAPTAWDLRCEVREKMIDFMQKHHSRSLPRLRGELSQEIS